MNKNCFVTKTAVGVRKINQQRRVIDLTVEKNHTFVHSSGVVVHNCQSVQPALRNFMESYSKNCRFILTCNFKNRIIPPLQSRCTNIDFNVTEYKNPKILKQMLDRLVYILNNEQVTYDKSVLAEIIMKWVPDFRRTINELQKYSTVSGGQIDSGMLVSGAIEVDVQNLVKHLKEKNFKEMRQWVVNHSDLDTSMIFRKIYDSVKDYVKPQSIPHVVLILAEYQYRDSFVVDHEINTVAAMTEIMMKCEFV